MNLRVKWSKKIKLINKTKLTKYVSSDISINKWD